VVFETILNPIFSPLLRLPFLLAIVIISFIISFLMILAYKKFTDQSLMKDLKGEIKELQKEMRKLRDKPQEMMQVQKRAMETNMKYMMHSFKPMLITFIPIIIIFGWLNSHMAYFPLVEDQSFDVLMEFKEGTEGVVELVDITDIEALNDKKQTIKEDVVKFELKGATGEYTLKFMLGEEVYENDIIIIDQGQDRVYKQPIKKFRNMKLSKLTVNNQKILAFEGIPVLSTLPWFGGFGWLGSYILFSLIFSLTLRKLFKVY
jgi:uncharacterized membrane protein (DUF106 family)